MVLSSCSKDVALALAPRASENDDSCIKGSVAACAIVVPAPSRLVVCDLARGRVDDAFDLRLR